MLGEPILAFDDFVYGTTPVYSSSYLDGALAELESYSIQAMVDSFSENALTVQLETSADGRNWIAKNPGIPEVSASFSSGSSGSYAGTDAGARPGLALVRLRIALANPGSAQVRIYVREGHDAGFVPNVLSPLVWLRADMGVTLDTSNNVVLWRDLTLHRYDAGQADPAKRPSLPTASQMVGGQPSIVFDAASGERLEIKKTLASLTAGHTFTVFRRSVQPPATAATAGFLWLGSSTLATHVPYTDGLLYDDTGSTTRRTGSAVPVMTGSAYCHEVVSSSSSWSSSLNGTVYAASGTNVVGFSDTPEIGGNSVVGAFFDGYIAEVVIFDRVLSSSERARLVEYFKNRYLIASFT